jgi:hypothetical protein
MKRLTSNNCKDDMSMVELAHNCCYAKDYKARYRDYDTDIDAREFARNLYKAYVGDEMPEDDDVFDDCILGDLMYDPEEPAGLIALFYRNLWAMADLRERLKQYEDAEEQGLLVRLPCKVGDYVWSAECGRVKRYVASHFDVCMKSIYAYEGDIFVGEIGYSVFATKEEAEAALEKMKGEEHESV